MERKWRSAQWRELVRLMGLMEQMIQQACWVGELAAQQVCLMHWEC
jgi:hypothetical protein